MKRFLLLLLLLMPTFIWAAETDTTRANPKKNHSIGLLPTITFDADLGFQYGGLVNYFDYGDGSSYPAYRYMLKMEVSRFTRGSGINQLFYDTRTLLPHNMRLTADLSYLTEKSLDFYGFNGYQSLYHPEYADEDEAGYISRMFYRHSRTLFRMTADVQGKFLHPKMRWLLGFGVMNFKIDTVDVPALNKKRDADNQIPYVESLYSKYVRYGIIAASEANGGTANFIKTGLIYDTRDQEANASKGMWSEALLVMSPKFFFNTESSFIKLILIHRQYFTLVPDKLTLACRLGYQGTIAGKTPFFFEPYMMSSFSSITKTDGLGGAKNLRGIIRNRIVGDGIAYGNAEFRYKFLKTHVKKAKLYFAFNAFADAGLVVQKIAIPDNVMNQADMRDYFDPSYSHDKLHPGAGAGLRIALNENFILAVDYGFALKPQDGARGLYINIGNLF